MSEAEPEPATRLICSDCGAVDGRGAEVQRVGHSLAEAGMRGNPPLCWHCDRRRSR